MVPHTVTNIPRQINDNEKHNLQSQWSYTAYMSIYIFHINSEVNPLPCSLSTLQYKMFIASDMFSYKRTALSSHQCYQSILFLPSVLTTDTCNVLYFYFVMAVMNLEYQHMCTLKM